MHFSGVRRTVRELISLLNRQCVHVGAQADRALRFPVLQRADNAGTAEPARDLESPVGQFLRNDVAGARFFKAKLGMGMNVAPDLLDFGTELDDSVDQLHEFLRG